MRNLLLLPFFFLLPCFSLAQQTGDVQNIVVEEATGIWCPFCPKGGDTLAQLEKDYGSRLIVLSYHDNDSMQTAPGDRLLKSLDTRSWPTADVGRTRFNIKGGGTFFMLSPPDWRFGIEKVIAANPTAPAKISITSLSYSRGDKKVDATISIENRDAWNLGDPAHRYSVTAIIRQDSIVGTQELLTSSGDETLDPYIHRHVVRSMWPDEKGLPLSVSGGTLAPGSTLPLALSFTIDTSITYDGDARPQPFDPARASLVLLVHETIGDSVGRILQAIAVPLPLSSAGVDGSSATAERLPWPNPAGSTITIPVAGDADMGPEAFRLFDARGVEITGVPSRTFQGSIVAGLKGLADGIYFYRVEGKSHLNGWFIHSR